jgi:hypothetical protein
MACAHRRSTGGAALSNFAQAGRRTFMAGAKLHVHPGDPGMGQPMRGSRAGLGGGPGHAAPRSSAAPPARQLPAQRDPTSRADAADFERFDSDRG